MSKVIALEEILVFHNFKENIDENEQNGNWVDKQKEIGDIGEGIVQRFLEEHYNAIVKKQPDSKGYDFWVKMPSKKMAVEVKTTTNTLKRFFISHNELKTAYKMGDNYYIYYLCIKEDKKNLYIIKNPIKTLQITVDMINKKLIENDMISAQIEGLVIDIKDLERFLVIEDLQ